MHPDPNKRMALCLQSPVHQAASGQFRTNGTDRWNSELCDPTANQRYLALGLNFFVGSSHGGPRCLECLFLASWPHRHEPKAQMTYVSAWLLNHTSLELAPKQDDESANAGAVPGWQRRLHETQGLKGKSLRDISNVLEGAARTRRENPSLLHSTWIGLRTEHSDCVDAGEQGLHAIVPCHSLLESRWGHSVCQALPSIPHREISKCVAQGTGKTCNETAFTQKP